MGNMEAWLLCETIAIILLAIVQFRILMILNEMRKK